jgi:hypothetical protein
MKKYPVSLCPPPKSADSGQVKDLNPAEALKDLHSMAHQRWYEKKLPKEVREDAQRYEVNLNRVDVQGIGESLILSRKNYWFSIQQELTGQLDRTKMFYGLQAAGDAVANVNLFSARTQNDIEDRISDYNSYATHLDELLAKGLISKHEGEQLLSNWAQEVSENNCFSSDLNEKYKRLVADLIESRFAGLNPKNKN